MGSYATKHDRHDMLRRFIEDLFNLGYKLPNIQGLKQKHIVAMVEHWKRQDLSNATMKNRLAAIRHLVTLMNKPSLVLSNDALGIGARRYIPEKNKALHHPDFSSVTDPYIKVSMELQRVYGLRREESLKIKPHLADKGKKIELQPSWCKGSRGRFIPIRTEEQRYWLEQAKMLAGKFGYSLIPKGKSYIQQRYIYDKQVASAGLKNLHGLRHAYAQQRYKELTGWEAPINGGPKKSTLTKEAREIDRQARMIITEELGHSRIQITTSYLA